MPQVPFSRTPGLGLPHQDVYLSESECRDLINRRAPLALRAARTIPKSSSFIEDLQARIEQLEAEAQQQLPFRQAIYGVARVGTDPVFAEVDIEGRLHVVYMIAGHQIMGVIAYEVGDIIVFDATQLDGDGNVTSGLLDGLARLRLSTGAPGQSADPFLVDETSHDQTARGTGCAYVYARYIFDEDVFTQGVPSMVVVVRGKPVTDLRDNSQKWSVNPALAAYDLLTEDDLGGGLGAPANLIDEQSVEDAADLAEETVATQQINALVVDVDDANDGLELGAPISPFQWCDQVRVTLGAGQSLPSGLTIGQNYWVTVLHDRVNDVSGPLIGLALSYDDAVRDERINIGDFQTEFTITKLGEPRFSMTGTWRSGDDRGGVLREILGTMGGSVIFTRGLFRLYGAAFQPPTIEITEDDIIGPVNVRPRTPRDERFNQVTGTYVSPLNLYRERTYPTVNGGGVFEEDDGEKLFADIGFGFCPRSAQAQRLAKIRLFELRQDFTVALPVKMSLYDIRANQTVQLTLPKLGWTQKEFRVETRQLFLQSANGAPRFGIEFALRATSSLVYDFDADEETLVEIARETTVPNVRTVNPPGQPLVTESLFQTQEGAGLRVLVTLNWPSANDPFFSRYRVRYRLTGTDEWIDLPDTEDTFAEIRDLAPARYDFQIRTVNTIGVRSAPVEVLDKRIFGLAATPSVPTNFGGQIVSTSALLQWDRHPALDVRIGGKIEVRHHSDCTGGQAENSLLLAEVTGDLTVAQVAAKRGCYYIRAIDQVDQKSDFAEWSTDFVGPVIFAQVISGGAFNANDSDDTEITLQEDPTFPSTNSLNTMIENVPLQVLELAPDETFDDAADVDALADWDAQGADPDSISPEGVYYFSTGIALDALTRMIIETVITSQAVNTADSFDERPGLVDNFESWDGESEPGAVDAWVEARFTRDDPTASPVWSPWERIESRTVYHRGVEFRAQGRSIDPAYQLRISQLRVLVRELPAAA